MEFGFDNDYTEFRFREGGARMEKKLVPLTVCLKECGTETAEALAGKLKVSTKTIRNYIKEWNDWLWGADPFQTRLRLLPGHRGPGGI